MNKLSLFSGIGGDDLASEWAGINTVCMVEKDKYCQQVLKKHWPNVPIIGDVYDVTKETVNNAIRNAECGGFSGEPRWRSRQEFENGCKTISDAKIAENRRLQQSEFLPDTGREYIDIISGGFPCQPHSVAGKHQGSADERNLWPEYRRIIGEIKPRWVVGENVPGIFSSNSRRFFGTILSDLAEMGYSVGWCTFGAVDVGAWHRRNRVFIVAYRNSFGQQQSRIPIFTEGIRRSRKNTDIGWKSQVSDSEQFNDDRWGFRTGKERQQEQTGILGREYRQSEPGLGRMANGLSYWLDGYWSREPDGIPRMAVGVTQRVQRLKGLGNAVVPQQVYPIYKAIMDINQKVQV